jgi:ribosomal protein S2
MANSLYNKLTYMKAMINSTYGVGYQNIKTNYDEIYSIRKRINIIELRKYKIKKICQIGK